MSLETPLALHVGASFPGGNSRITAKISGSLSFFEASPENTPHIRKSALVNDFLLGFYLSTTLASGSKNTQYILYFSVLFSEGMAGPALAKLD